MKFNLFDRLRIYPSWIEFMRANIAIIRALWLDKCILLTTFEEAI